MNHFKHLILTTVAVIIALTASAQDITYQMPPREIAEIIMSKPFPNVTLSPDYKRGVIAERESALVPLATLAAEELRIGGMRINPRNFTQTRESFFNSVTILDVATGGLTQIEEMPADAKIREIKWSPSGKYFCFLNETPEEMALWRVNVSDPTPKAVKINKYKVNSTLSNGNTYEFLDDERIIYKSVPENIGPVPTPTLPNGPVVQENIGDRKSVRTFQDLLSSPFDKVLYDYYCTVVFAIYDNGNTSTAGPAGVVREYDISPDSRYMMVTTEQHPYSYMEGHNSFPSIREIRTISGETVVILSDTNKEKAEKELRDKAPKDTSATGIPEPPRKLNFEWRADMPATLVWTEGSSGPSPFMAPNPDADNKEDEPEKKFTDKVYQCPEPFNFDDKQLVVAPEYKIGRITWGNPQLAVYTESSQKQKFRRTVAFTPCDTIAPKQILFTESTDVDTLGNFPVYGRFWTVNNQYGKKVLYTDSKNSHLFLNDTRRPDAEGDNFSFIDRITIKNGKIENLWNGAAPYQERVIAITDFDRLKFISERQSISEVPNYYAVDTRNKKNSHRQFTFFENTVPMLSGVTRNFVTYKRADGVTLSANLWLPAGYDQERDGKLPVLMWGYPYEYKCAAEAQKSRPARYNFLRPGYGSAVLWVTQGYAVMDGISMYIISENKEKEPNDVFLSQLIMNAEAAINFVDSIGVGDRDRVAIGGHSYGGFMTANLLAHTDLFKAGIARSGAYNRSLTPFGFQSEKRNYWKAKEVYDKMSPFNYADKLKTPILIIHGQMDDNSGTFPIQSERLYHAVAGHGGTARYLQLPYESHGYSAYENVMHMLYETDAWMAKWLSPEEVAKVKERQQKEKEKKDKAKDKDKDKKDE